MPEKFSKRNNYTSSEKEITIREDAPRELREYIPQLAYDTDYSAEQARRIICRVLKKAPDRSNWSRPNIEHEVNSLLDDCEWYEVYDIIEALYDESEDKAKFDDEVNDYFKRNGIGWKLEDGSIVFRGTDAFETRLRETEKILAQSNLKTANREIHEAINDLSKKPQADITGAIQHSVSCLECVAREASGTPKKTLGELIKDNPSIVPEPLNTVITKIWAFASNKGRHLQEGNDPTFEEAELLVGLSASLATFLARQMRNQS